MAFMSSKKGIQAAVNNKKKSEVGDQAALESMDAAPR